MKQLIIFSLLLFSLTSMAQNAIVSAGNDKENVSWTIGETLTETIIGDFIVTQGFNQPNNNYGTGIEIVDTQVKIQAYPNPVRNNLIITVPDVSQYTWIFTDIQGRKIKSGVSDMDKTDVDLSLFAKGQYILTIKLIDRIQSMIIIKN